MKNEQALALRDEAARYIVEASNLILLNPELKTEIVVIDDMAVMVAGFRHFNANDFEGITKDSCELFSSVIDYVKFLKRKK